MSNSRKEGIGFFVLREEKNFAAKTFGLSRFSFFVLRLNAVVRPLSPLKSCGRDYSFMAAFSCVAVPISAEGDDG